MALHRLAPRIKKVLDENGIQQFYHFTAVDNLALIAQCGGLWSKERLEHANLLDKLVTGGNELSLNLDRQVGNWDKVHLYFCPKTPMAYRVQQNPEGRNPQSVHLCYLSIDQSVALMDGVYFTDTNATRLTDGHQREEGLEGLKLVDFGTIRAHLNRIPVPKQVWHRNVQAECLVPDEIPLRYVKGVSFMSDASLKEGERLWQSSPHPPFRVDRRLFHLGFPQVEQFSMTSANITKENVHTTQFRDEREFSRGKHTKVTLLVNLYATAGCPRRIVWYDGAGNRLAEDSRHFENEGRYRHWPSVDLVNLKDGDHYVEYYLNDTRWFTTYFRLRRQP